MSDTKKPGMAHDGWKTNAPLTKGYRPIAVTQPKNVQGGYQAPGGGRPAAPITGSGVNPSKTAPKK